MLIPVENPPHILRFGDFEVDAATGLLRRRGVRVKLQDQPLQILLMLLLRPGQAVTREELRKTLWPSDTFVDFDHSLNSAVMRLREALGDSAERPRFVETLPKRGYRFLAPVTPVSTDTQSPTENPRSSKASEAAAAEIQVVDAGNVAKPTLVLAPSITSTETPQAAPVSTSAPAPLQPAIETKSRANRLVVGTVLLILIVAVIGVVAWRQLRAGRGERIESLVVLPIENLTGDSNQDYLADGITDELTADLAKIRSLRVISRTSAMSYKGTRKPLPDIAHDLKVDAVVEGTLRRSGNRIRITAELIQASSDRHLWVETYDTQIQDILATESDVVRAIAKEIRVKFTPEQQRQLAARAMGAAPYETYLKGRYYWNQRTADGMKRAIGYFEQAIQQDPNSALAYAGLADAYDIMASAIIEAVPTKDAYPKAKEAALRAVQLDDSLAEAHTSLATMSFNYDWNWPAAERELKRALEIDPNYATAHQRYSIYLMAMGRTDESLTEMTRAHTLDPLSVSINFSLGWRLFFAHRYDDAIAQLRATLEMDPNFALAHRVLGQVYEQKGQLSDAILELQTAARLSSDSPLVLGALGHAYAHAGRRRDAEQVLQHMLAKNSERYVSPIHIAEVYAGLGDRESTFQWLDKALQDRSNGLVFLKVDPGFDILRSDPAFLEVLRKVGLP